MPTELGRSFVVEVGILLYDAIVSWAVFGDGLDVSPGDDGDLSLAWGKVPVILSICFLRYGFREVKWFPQNNICIDTSRSISDSLRPGTILFAKPIRECFLINIYPAKMTQGAEIAWC